MSQDAERNLVNVEIGGESYGIRAQASAEYTRECAAYVDQRLAEMMRGGSLLQAQKGLILTALSLADELLQARAELNALRTELTRRSDALTAQIEDRLAGRGLAGGS